MKYSLLVAWREYAENAKAKGFWISLLLMPAMLFLSLQAPIWLEQKATPIRYYVLVDQSGKLGAAVAGALDAAYRRRVHEAEQEYVRKNVPAESLKTLGLESGGDIGVEGEQRSGGSGSLLDRTRTLLKPGAPAFIPPRRLFQEIPLPAAIDSKGNLDGLADALRPYMRGEMKLQSGEQWVDLAAAILIPADIDASVVRPGTNVGAAARSRSRPIQFWSVNASDPRLHDEIEHAINSEIRRGEYQARGLDAAAVSQVELTYAPFASLNPKKEKGKEAVGTTDTIRQWAPSAFVYLLWLAIFVIVQMLLNNTIEEKSNRIIEVLLSSVTPGELMMGKLIGIAAIGLTMIGVWMLALFGILSWKAGGASELAGQMLTVLKGSNLVMLFSVYFLLGYLMYAGFILSIGSVCNTIKEAQSYMGVLTMIMMVPLLTMTFIPKDPNGPLARVLSWIPLYTPFTMMNRAAADPPLVDLIGTFVLLVFTAGLALWMSGKVFRIGILRTGQPPKVVEMLRWALRKD